MTVTLAVYPETSALLDSLRTELLGQPGGPEVETLMDPEARAHRDSGVWEFLSVACGTGGAVTVAVKTIGQWIAATVTTVRVKVGEHEFVVHSRDVDVVMPKVTAAVEALQRRGLPASGSAADGGSVADAG